MKKPIKVRKAGKMVKSKKKPKISEDRRKLNASRWLQERRGLIP